ncbi:MAG TPA: polynucleotide adenylyltransferase PcnB [Gaiellaceae bacterium]|nr:polynucleotide adenylyltransferase PcnB [Gaiellaceae bacterium]
MEDVEVASESGDDITAEPAVGRALATRESPKTRSRRSEPPARRPIDAQEIDEEGLGPVDDEDDAGMSPGVHPLELLEGRIDADAEKVVRRLVRHGFDAYLVGGCVRDLLLGRSPKDFDVATSARPDDVRRLFRNSRIIGRRFRLVHVLFGGGKVIETATFRKTPEEDRDGDDLLIRNDNVFGEAHEDANRRDFTINALFYDFERRAVLDWVGGMPDIEERVVRTIGDPIVRFREDPVRILRAIKFSARLDLAIAEDVYDAIVVCRDGLARAARPRLFEELLRLMRGGAAHRSIWLCWETGVLDVLLPELSAYLADTAQDNRGLFRLLDAVDRTTRQRREPLEDTVLWTVLLLEPLREACEGARDRVAAAYDFLEPIVERLAVPRRIADAMRRVVAALPRLEAGRAGRFTKTALYATASEVLALCQAARTEDGAAEAAPAAADASAEAKPARRRRRRRKKGPRPDETAPPASTT